MFSWYNPPEPDPIGRCPVCDKKQEIDDYCSDNCFKADNPYD
jgi:predicted nucleic acid-binding Zn ribbon protein